MILYIFLALLAMIFTVFGVFLHAFCFPYANEAANDRGEATRKDAEAKSDDALHQAQEEIARLNNSVRSLEQELRLKTEELETRRLLTTPPVGENKPALQSQEDELGPGNKNSKSQKRRREESDRGSADSTDQQTPVPARRISKKSAARGAARPKAQGGDTPTDEKATAAPDSQAPLESAGPEVEPKNEPAAANWKDNLKSTLNILDKMEKEVEK